MFGRITALATDPDGRIYVADAGNGLVRVIDLDGRVTTLAGLEPPPEGAGARPTGAGLLGLAYQLAPSGMVLDPLTGDLLVADGHSIRRIGTRGDARGSVTTLVGHPARPGFQEPGGRFRAEPGHPCLSSPAGLHLQGLRLFIADTGNRAIQMYHLDTRELVTLAGHPTQTLTSPGPLGLFSPLLPRAQGAAMDEPRAVALDARGSCLVGLPHGLVNLDLAALDTLFPASLAKPAPEADGSSSSSIHVWPTSTNGPVTETKLPRGTASAATETPAADLALADLTAALEDTEKAYESARTGMTRLTATLLQAASRTRSDQGVVMLECLDELQKAEKNLVRVLTLQASGRLAIAQAHVLRLLSETRRQLAAAMSADLPATAGLVQRQAFLAGLRGRIADRARILDTLALGRPWLHWRTEVGKAVPQDIGALVGPGKCPDGFQGLALVGEGTSPGTFRVVWSTLARAEDREAAQAALLGLDLEALPPPTAFEGKGEAKDREAVHWDRLVAAVREPIRAALGQFPGDPAHAAFRGAEMKGPAGRVHGALARRQAQAEREAARAQERARRSEAERVERERQAEEQEARKLKRLEYEAQRAQANRAKRAENQRLRAEQKREAQAREEAAQAKARRQAEIQRKQAEAHAQRVREEEQAAQAARKALKAEILQQHAENQGRVLEARAEWLRQREAAARASRQAPVAAAPAGAGAPVAPAMEAKRMAMPTPSAATARVPNTAPGVPPMGAPGAPETGAELEAEVAQLEAEVLGAFTDEYTALFDRNLPAKVMPDMKKIDLMVLGFLGAAQSTRERIQPRSEDRKRAPVPGKD